MKTFKLKKGEVHCDKCAGSGVIEKFEVCTKCNGEGKLDWVEAVVGKKKPPSTKGMSMGGWSQRSENGVEIFDGTSWSAKGDLSTPISELAGMSPTLKELLDSKKNKI